VADVDWPSTACGDLMYEGMRIAAPKLYPWLREPELLLIPGIAGAGTHAAQRAVDAGSHHLRDAIMPIPIGCVHKRFQEFVGRVRSVEPRALCPHAPTSH
jgi:hypothetical protein